MIEKIIKFGFVGIFSTLLDYIILFVLKEKFYLGVLYASAFSFIISVLFNYTLSMRFVFIDKKDMSKIKEVSIFFLTAILGLIINQMVMYISIEKLKIYYMISKVLATAIVMFWNFASRYIFLEKI